MNNPLFQTLASYGLFFIISFFAWKMKRLNIPGHGIGASLKGINMKNLAGIIIFIVPLNAHYHEWSLYFSWPASVTVYQLIILLLLLIGVAHISFHTAGKQLNNRMENGCNETIPLSSALAYLIPRIFFLIAYECFFRGLVLALCIGAFGIFMALAINISLYVIIHVFNGKREIFSCVPFGLLLAGATISFQSVWPAILLHVVLAVVYESRLLLYSASSFKTIRR